MTSLIDELKRRVDETRSALDSVRQTVARAEAKEEGLTADLAGYEQAHRAELRRSGAESSHREAEAIKAQDVATAAATLEALSGDDAANKTELVETIIRERASTGVAPTDVYSELERRNIPVKRNYIYSILGRLMKRERIRRRRGRYFPASAAMSAGKVVDIAG